MRHFKDILNIAEERHGGLEAVEARIPPVRDRNELTKIAGDRWLSDMTKNVFRAGFSRKVINDRWQGFEAAFGGFDLHKCAALNDEWLDTLLKDTRIVRNGARIQSVQRNAVFILDEMENHGSFGAFLSSHGPHDFATLMASLHKDGDRLGDKTAQYFLREAGLDGYVLSFDVLKRLNLEGITDKVPSSKVQRQKVQDAFDTWREQSGKNLTYVSRVLAMSVSSDKPSPDQP